MKKQNRVIKKAAATLVAVIFCLMLFAVSAFAEGEGNAVTQPLINFTALMFTIIRLVGIALGAFSIVQFATALKSHDGAQKVQAGLGIAAGLMIIFAKEILELIGVPIV